MYKNKHGKDWWLKVIILMAAALSIVGIAVYIFHFRKGVLSDSTSDFGAFGAYLSGILGASIGLISCIFVYKAHMAQLDVNAKQELQFKRQQFDSVFFDLMATHRDILNRIVISVESQNWEGLDESGV